MAYITCPHCQHEFLLNQEETRPSHIAGLEDRIHELEHSERVNNLESNQLKHSNRLVDLESEVDALRRFVKASGRYKPRSKEIEDKFNQGQQGWFEHQLESALQEIEWLKERVEDIERAAAEQKSHINALHLSRERLQGQVAEAQALSPEQIEKVLRDTAEKKTIDVAAERIEKLENALHSRLLELENWVFERPWGDKASAAREEAIEDRVEKLEQSFQAFVPPAIEDRVKKLEQDRKLEGRVQTLERYMYGQQHTQPYDAQKLEELRQSMEAPPSDKPKELLLYEQKLDYIVETLYRQGYNSRAVLTWLAAYADIDQAHAEAQRYTETTN